MRLKTFILGLVWLCLLPMLMLAVALGVDHVRDEQADSERHASLSARSAANAVDRGLAARIGALQLLVPGLMDEPSRFKARGQHYRSAFGGDVALVDASSAPPGGVADPAIEAVRLAADSNRPAITVGRGSAGAMVFIAVPAGTNGAVDRVVRATMPIERIASMLGGVMVPDSWSMVLRDDRGIEVARVGAPPDDGDDSPSVGVRSSVAPWTVSLYRPSSEHWDAAWEASLWIALLVLATAAIAWAIAAYGGRRLQAAMGAVTGPAAPKSAARITEFRAVRKLLDDAASSEAMMRGRVQRSEIDLEMREDQLRGIVEGASDGIVTVDDSQTIVMANPAAAHIFGYTVPELVGRPLEMLIPARFRTLHAQQVRDFAVARVTARPMGSGLEVKALRADGTEFAIEASISHVHVDGQGLFTVMVRDVTEQRRAQAEATASRNILRAALASMSDAVLITDAQGQIVEANDACRTFLRLQDKSQCPRTLADFESLLDVFDANGTPVPPSRCAVPRALHGEVGSTVEFHLVRKDTGEGWIGSHNFAPIRNADGQIVGAVLAARDVTDLKRMHDELAASQADLRRLVAMQDRVQEAERKRIARELHDDLQQTLAAILIEGGAARQALRPGSEGARTPLQHIDELASAAIASTRRIVNDLRPRMLEELGLVPALEALAHRFEEHSGIACRFDPSAAASVNLAAPQVGTCLYRVAQETLNNVSKHAHARRAWIELADAAPGRLRLRVGDDGQGMQPSARRKPQAFGLVGMSERMRAMGGTIRIDTAVGAGTVVEVEVPLAGQAPDVRAEAAAPP